MMKPKLIRAIRANPNGFVGELRGRILLRMALDHRASGASFPWERYSPAGELIQCYWVKDHCIEREPLQIEAEVWDLCANYPEKYSLLLATLDETPVVFSGKQLRSLRDSGRVTLFPASYRLVYEHDQAEEKSDE